VTTDEPTSTDFVRAKVAEDNASAKFGQRIQTRFPPEPNGYLHIGHAKSIGLNFGVASEFGGACNLRFDDTNPETEEQRFIDSIQEDLAWLGYTPDGEVKYASDYFDQLYDWAETLITKGVAYVDDQDAETISELIYPTYDWAHGQSDAIEGVTHSLCTLEFSDHRALYDWCLEQLDLPFEKPEQTEFARLALTHTRSAGWRYCVRSR